MNKQLENKQIVVLQLIATLFIEVFVLVTKLGWGY